MNLDQPTIAPGPEPLPETIRFVVRAQAGDRGAFGRLVERYKNAVSAVALAAVRDIGMSEDVAQNAFIQAWIGLHRLRRPESFGPWLLQLARNQAMQAHRTRRRARRRDDHWSRLQPGAAPDAETVAHAAEDHRDLLAALEQLPDDTREILVLYYREGQSTRQVAALFELSEAAVRKRIERARTALRERLEAVGALAAASAPGAAFVALVLGSIDAEAALAVGAARPPRSPRPPRSLASPSTTLKLIAAALAVGALGLVTLRSSHSPQEHRRMADRPATARTQLAPIELPLPPTTPAVVTAVAPDDGGAIVGRVTNADGRPVVARVVVTARGRGTLAAPPVTSGDDGTFQVTGLGAGGYDIRAETEAQHASVENIRLGPGGAFFAEIALAPLAAPLIGRVVDDTGAPISGRTVDLRGHRAPAVTLPLDGDGWFRLPRGYPRGRARLYLSRSGARSTRERRGPYPGESAVENAAWGQTINIGPEPLHIVVPREGTIRGEVVAARGNKAPRSRCVLVMRQEESGACYSALPQILDIAPDGTFTASLPAATYVLRTDRVDRRVTYIVRAQAVEHVVLDEGEAPRLRVRVEEADGTPASGAAVHLGSMELDPTDAQGVTLGYDEDVESVLPAELWVENEGRAARAWLLSLPRGEPREEMILRLAAAGRIRGRVVRTDGAPVSAIRVTPMRVDAPWFREPAATRFGGDTFELGGVVPGEVRVRVEGEGGAAGVATATLAPGGEAEVVVPLGEAGSLRGRVVPDGDEMPHPLPVVVLLGHAEHVERDGTFHLAAVPPGAHTLVVQAYGEVVASTRVLLGARQAVELGDIRIYAGR